MVSVEYTRISFVNLCHPFNVSQVSGVVAYRFPAETEESALDLKMTALGFGNSRRLEKLAKWTAVVAEKAAIRN
jgi:hypothetical protein